MNVVVTGGGTSARIDDVRVITNLSSGRFAAAISESCLLRGGKVWHVHTPAAERPLFRHARMDLETGDPGREIDRLLRLYRQYCKLRTRLHCVPLRLGTVSEYARTLKDVITSRPIDIVFLAMAVSDYEPIPSAGKFRSDVERMVIECTRTQKVIQSVRDWAPSVYLVGFKLLSRVSTEELIREAEIAGRVNRADLTVANDLQTLIAGEHTIHLVRPEAPTETLGPAPDLADQLVDRVFRWSTRTSPDPPP